MRTFIAIDIPENIKKGLINFTEKCRSLQSDGIKYVEKGNMHITLKFLGELSEEQIENLSRDLAFIKFKAFPISVKTTGAFPNIFFPRVIWAGIFPVENLLEIFSKIESASINNGIPAEERPFSPHITLARIKSRADKGWADFLKQNNNLDFGSFMPDGFSLYKSELNKSGPVYTKLKHFLFEEK